MEQEALDLRHWWKGRKARKSGPALDVSRNVRNEDADLLARWAVELSGEEMKWLHGANSHGFSGVGRWFRRIIFRSRLTG